MKVDQLPDVLYKVILSFISIEDQIEFAKTNKILCNLLIKDVRHITITSDPTLEKLERSESYRNRLLGLINHPYKQLTINEFPRNTQLQIVSSFASFTTTVFNGLYRKELSQVHHLTLYGTCDIDIDTEEIEKFLYGGDFNSLRVRKLTLIGSAITELPTISKIETLELMQCELLPCKGINIPSYTHLQSLKLFECGSIVDVSSLSHISDLSIEICDEITDISCLNNNNKVLISQCKKIHDFSKSFRNAKVIIIRTNSPLVTNPRLENAYSVHTLLLSDESAFSTIQTGELYLPPSPYLRVVGIFSCPIPFIIPKLHTIQDLSITACKQFYSCMNMRSIYKISLSSLPICSLNGLGKGNHIVEIRLCDHIADFRPLQYCDKVTIEKCSGLINLSYLRNVKEVIIGSLILFPERLTPATSLMIGIDTPFTMNRLLTTMKKVRTITFCDDYLPILKEGISCIMQDFPRIQKVLMSQKNFQEICQSDSEFEEMVRRVFIVERVFQSEEVSLLRRLIPLS